ncbi:endo-1,4-beta-xylanase [Natronorubrum texcoconense]|uniref:endo-1,4-beta-xylanase n=1 Tax=Natronorubrum texcoconense TaxID=1095776 RepID=A0A1G9CTX0_9EURY|nr:endo-1,4-beta-xylanase [Natronorubrum texcoconense]SDK55069.1 endo-1,4-beta-xylanase [Natronorubrum texcoconense]
MSAEPTESTLRDVADEREFTIGTAIDPDSLRRDPSYWKTASSEFNAVTPENALKMGPLRPSRHTYDFRDADAVVNFGRENDMTVRGHTLVWHNQKPEWFQAWDYTDEQLRQFLREHIHTVVGRYRETVDAWDVVNEAVADDGSMRRTVWSDALGEDYLEEAFTWAREVNPDADLYYNDYGADEINEKSDAIYDLLEGLLERDVPIDGVGLQLHALGDHPDPDSIAENIERFRDLGLEVQITEMDVAFHADDVPADALEIQADYYREVVEACLEAGCDTIVTWDVHDANSWLRSFKDFGERYSGDPLLFDDRYERKPAYYAVRDALEE